MSSSRSQSPNEEEQQPNQGYVFPEGRIIPNTLFVGGIDVNMDEIEIKELFSKYGPVKDVKIIADRSGASKGYGFVSYYDVVDVQKIIDSQISFHGKRLKLGPAIRKNNLCTYAQQRHVVIRTPAPQYSNVWSVPLSEPYVQNTPVFSPVSPYVQACPYSSSSPVLYQQVPFGCQQPGCYQGMTWNCFNDAEMASSEIVPPETYNQEQNVPSASTSPLKKVDRGIQTILSCLLNGDGRLQRAIVSQDDYFKDRRVHHFRRSRSVFKSSVDKNDV
ncbi:deleted in azoospermia-like isoform X2 [Dendropsophus ebraccatus]|uniref:deleted in azoospermia-like isoform X2 n=1 Tax=Dendropsophus ebraccatus TaxID=150705 RepID=UPI0038317A7F